jgi:hypothetical protein
MRNNNLPKIERWLSLDLSMANHRHKAEYTSWRGMIQRCTNPNDANYSRSIRVCDRWRSFAEFFKDMGPRPPGTSLFRIDGNGNYEPGNCRWASASTHSHNKRHRPSKTDFRGVHFSSGKYFARIQANRKSHYLGTFATAAKAHQAYAAAAVELYGESARTN